MTTMVRAVGAALLVLVAAGCVREAEPIVEPPRAEASLPPGVVAIEQGKVRGLVHDGVASFRGIPYAAPPVGDLRFRPPAPAESWDGTRDATHFGPHCVEVDPYRREVMGGDEDCLSINVWAKAARSATPLPVLFFVHGGFNLRGASSAQQGAEYYYPGEWLARNGPAIVVTVNYRVGAFGFLAHPALTAERADRSSGNAGILDVTAALHWVQKNAAAFGGDPSNVLLFGQSAGAIDSCALMTSTEARGLFSRVLMMSGNCHRHDVERRLREGLELAHRSGCDDPANAATCLRALSASELAARMAPAFGAAEITFGVTGDDILVQRESSFIKKGFVNQVPLMIGTTVDEFSMMGRIYGDAVANGTADYDAVFQKAFAERAPAMRALYPATAFSTPKDAFLTALSDLSFTCPARRLARFLARDSHRPVYRYLFANRFDNSHLGAFGAAHGYDVPFVFHNVDTVFKSFGFSPAPSERALADAMAGAVLRFARSGDPNGTGLPAWPRAEPGHDRAMLFDKETHAIEGVRSAACDALDAEVSGRR